MFQTINSLYFVFVHYSWKVMTTEVNGIKHNQSMSNDEIDSVFDGFSSEADSVSSGSSSFDGSSGHFWNYDLIQTYLLVALSFESLACYLCSDESLLNLFGSCGSSLVIKVTATSDEASPVS